MYQSLTGRVDIQVVLIDLSDVASIQSARASLTSIIEKTSEVAELSSAIGTALHSAWTEIPAGVPRAILTPVSKKYSLSFLICSNNLCGIS